MKIYTLPRIAVIRKMNDGNIDFNKVNIVSINTKFQWYGENSELKEMQDLFKGYEDSVLFCQFDDITEEHLSRMEKNSDPKVSENVHKFKVFTEEDAERILAFAEKTENEGKDLIVHCTAGVSRSAAISDMLNVYINRLLKDNKDDFNALWNERSPCANPHVTRIMKKVIDKKINNEVD